MPRLNKVARLSYVLLNKIVPATAKKSLEIEKLMAIIVSK
jgi:hypothetical protein